MTKDRADLLWGLFWTLVLVVILALLVLSGAGCGGAHGVLPWYVNDAKPVLASGAGAPRAAEPLPPMPGQSADVPARVQTFFVQPAPTNVVTLAADFEPTPRTNLTAFIQASTDLTNWSTIGALQYQTNGGTVSAPYTNATGVFFFRAGYTIH